MKRFMLGMAAAALAIPTAAHAADLPARPVYKAPVAAPIVGNWTGCYVGVNAGWIGGLDDLSTSPGPASAFGGQQFNPSPNAHTYSPNGSDVTAGGQIGCNWQTGV